MIIAQLTFADGSRQSRLAGLRADPLPGDGIDLIDGSRVLVIRRSFVELDATHPDPDRVDINLLVRPL